MPASKPGSVRPSPNIKTVKIDKDNHRIDYLKTLFVAPGLNIKVYIDRTSSAPGRKNNYIYVTDIDYNTHKTRLVDSSSIAGQNNYALLSRFIKTQNAELAVNGGFYSYNIPRHLIGLYVVNGKFIHQRDHKIEHTVCLDSHGKAWVYTADWRTGSAAYIKNHFPNIQSAVAGRHWLVKNYKINYDHQWWPKEVPYTIAVIDKHQHLQFVVVDHMNIRQLAYMITSFGFKDALSIDGGSRCHMDSRSLGKINVNNHITPSMRSAFVVVNKCAKIAP